MKKSRRILDFDKFSKTNEAVIIPRDIKQRVEEVTIEMANNIELLNNHFADLDIKFMYRDEFRDSLSTDIEKKGVPMDCDAPTIIMFAAYNPYIRKICVVHEKDRTIKSSNGLEVYKRELFKILRHETIHQSQVSKMNKIVYNLEVSPMKSPRKYFAQTEEVMAYANTLIDELVSNGYTIDKIKNELKNGTLRHPLYLMYIKGFSEETRKLFLKYLYQYLEIADQDNR